MTSEVSFIKRYCENLGETDDITFKTGIKCVLYFCGEFCANP